MQIGKGEAVCLGESTHFVEGGVGIGVRIVRTNRRHANSRLLESCGVAHDPVDNSFHVRTVIADEHDKRAAFAAHVIQRVGFSIGGG